MDSHLLSPRRGTRNFPARLGRRCCSHRRVRRGLV